ncbi:hypothetical protein TKV_c13250 [Thermoanaerobacter kivui]|uniref:Uncharacterized protein n=1 Tax=Thermoanaerobacter kivui TaxID=2325 RepID=A0A097ARP3_THEKI|nr:hypothetical protein [Thermoanaerobacter kivui]AIS52496.1 hypothetical protein TKV_c13250 [Thermoanaerobacter kivui]
MIDLNRFIGMDLQEVIEKLPKNAKFDVFVTKPIFEYKGYRLKVIRIIETKDVFKITVARF